MRILVAAVGAPGHAFPLVPLAAALRDAGHAVVFATGPDVVDTVATAGLETITAGGRLREVFEATRERLGLSGWPTDPDGVARLAAGCFGDVLPRGVLPDLVPWVEAHRPDLVVAEIGDPGAALAAATAGVPCVLHGFGRRPDARAPMYHRARGHVLVLAGELGLGLAEGAPLGHAVLDVCPPALQAAPIGDELPELPLRSTAWNPPVTGVAPPDPARPWIYLTLGTAMGRPAVLRTAAQALARLGPDVLVAAGPVEPGALDGVAGGRVRVEPFVAQAELLASDHPPVLVVHHGGSGTTLAAAAAGIPQLLVPQGADQFVNAAAVTAVGAGVTLDPAPDAAAVADAATALLTEQPRRAAGALAAEIAAMPAPAEVAARVEQWGRPRQD